MARNSSMYGKNIRLTLSKTLIKQYIAETAIPTCMSYYDYIAQLFLYISRVTFSTGNTVTRLLVWLYNGYSIKWYEENKPIS